MAGLSLQGRSERISDAMILTTEELGRHQRELMEQRADAVEKGIARQITEIDKMLGRIGFEMSMRNDSVAPDEVFDELVSVAR